MIDFACKSFKLKDIIKCSLNLTRSDYELLEFLMKNDEKDYTTMMLSKSLKLNITTIQKSVKKLHDKNVIFRSQKNLENGGYIYFYKIKDKKFVRDMINNIVRSWANKVETELKKW